LKYLRILNSNRTDGKEHGYDELSDQ